MKYEFEVVFDKEKETEMQKAKRWIEKQKPPLNLILRYLFSFVEEWYLEGKVKQTMSSVDRQAEEIVEQWEKEDERREPEIVETGVFGEEGWSLSMSNPYIERGTEKPEPSVGTSSNEKRLQEIIPDPWDDPLM
jgi:hypothetical protein